MNNVYATISLNNTEVKLSSDSPSALADMVKSLVGSVKAVASEVASVAAPKKNKVGRPKGRARLPRTSWSVADLTRLVTLSRELGVGHKSAATVIAKQFAANPDNRRSMDNLQVMSYRIYRYLTVGATYGLSKKVQRDLRAIGAVPRGMVVVSSEEMLPSLQEMQSTTVPVQMA